MSSFHLRTHGSPLSLVLLPCALLVFCASPAYGQAAQATVAMDARALYEAGLQDFKAQKYDAAVALLSQSFALDPQPQTLFAWAQSERLRSHCDEAARLFDQFIALAPPERQVAAAQLAKRRCAPPPAVVSAPAPAPTFVRATPWYVDTWGGALCGIGTATAAAGLALVVSSHALAGQAEGAATLGQSQSDRQVAEQRWAWGVGLTLAGTFLIAGGVTRYVWISKSDDRLTMFTGGRF